jgi:hypothetical protein
MYPKIIERNMVIGSKYSLYQNQMDAEYHHLIPPRVKAVRFQFLQLTNIGKGLRSQKEFAGSGSRSGSLTLTRSVDHPYKTPIAPYLYL